MAHKKSFSKFEQFCNIDAKNMVNLADLECVKSFIYEDYENDLDSIKYEVTSWCSLYNHAKSNTEKRYGIKLKTYILLDNIAVYDFGKREYFKTDNAYAMTYGHLEQHNSRLNSARYNKHYSIIIGKDLICELCREIKNNNDVDFDIIYSQLVELTGWERPVKQFTSFYNRLIFSVSVNAILYHEVLHIMKFNTDNSNDMPEEREADNFAGFLVTNFFSTLLHPDNKIYSNLTSATTRFKHAAYLVLTGAMLVPHTLKVLQGIQNQSEDYDSSLARMWSYISEFFNYIKRQNFINPEEAETILLNCFCAFLRCNNTIAIQYLKIIENELNVNILIDKTIQT